MYTQTEHEVGQDHSTHLDVLTGYMLPRLSLFNDARVKKNHGQKMLVADQYIQCTSVSGFLL